MGKEFAGVVTRKVRSRSRKAYSRRKKGGEDCSLLLRVGGIKISAVSCIYLQLHCGCTLSLDNYSIHTNYSEFRNGFIWDLEEKQRSLLSFFIINLLFSKTCSTNV
jgi:hypothetical protein